MQKYVCLFRQNRVTDRRDILQRDILQDIFLCPISKFSMGEAGAETYYRNKSDVAQFTCDILSQCV